MCQALGGFLELSYNDQIKLLIEVGSVFDLEYIYKLPKAHLLDHCIHEVLRKRKIEKFCALVHQHE